MLSKQQPIRLKAGFLTESVEANAERKTTAKLEFYDGWK